MSTRYFLFLFMVIALLVFADVDIATSENIQDILKSLQCSAQSMPGDEIITPRERPINYSEMRKMTKKL